MLVFVQLVLMKQFIKDLNINILYLKPMEYVIVGKNQKQNNSIGVKNININNINLISYQIYNKILLMLEKL